MSEAPREGKGQLEIPPEVMAQLVIALEGTAHLGPVLAFLCSEDGYHTRFLQVLKDTVKRPEVFKAIATQLAKDASRVADDQSFASTMRTLWDNYLTPEEKEKVGDGQLFDWSLLLADGRVHEEVMTYNLVVMLSRMPPNVQLQLIKQAASLGSFLGSSVSRAVESYTTSAVQIARRMGPYARALCTVALVGVYLTFDVVMNIRRWMKGEISGQRCAKIIIDSGFSLVGGVGGGLAGAALGTLIFPGIGTIVGGIIGGIAATELTRRLSDWVTQMIFDIPKDEALENAYRFLGLTCSTSNGDINSSFRSLCLKHHPDKGGNVDEFHKLQYSMALIKASREL